MKPTNYKVTYASNTHAGQFVAEAVLEEATSGDVVKEWKALQKGVQKIVDASMKEKNEPEDKEE